jgi:hypothetical protein
MSLKCVVNSLTEVAGPLWDYYKKTADGRFALVLDGEPAGYVKSSKLDEFRANNRDLHTAKTELESRLKAFDGIDPDAARAALAVGTDPAKVSDLEEKLAAAAANAETLKAQHAAELAALQSDQTNRATNLEAALTAEKSAHAATQLRNAISVEFLRAGGRESAVDFMVGKAAGTFEMKNGVAISREFSTARPGEPLSISEWVTQQSHICDFAFKPSRGGGAVGSSGAPPRRTVSSDPLEFGRNIADIASGDVTVL